MVSFSGIPLRPNAFSERPLHIVKPEDKAAFSLLTEILLLETGDRAAREAWQQAQLANIFRHAQQRSRFWAARLGGAKPSAMKLRKLPELSRADLIAQVNGEGPLLGRADGVSTQVHSTSGSTGQPVRIHVSEANAIYNELRFFAQYLIDGRDLRLRRLRTNPVFPLPSPGYRLTEHPSYANHLSELFQTGISASLEYATPDMKDIGRVIRSVRPGVVAGAPRFLELVIAAFGIGFFESLKLKGIICSAEGPSDELRAAFAAIDVPLQANYSSEEMGPIAFECVKVPKHYHVATSNVVVETAPAKVNHEGVTCSRLLVTHLHSYATPLIRYDLGDLGNLAERCPCGHDGPVIKDLFGRLAATAKRRDGSRFQLHVRGKDIEAILPTREFRVRQTDIDRIVVEVVAENPTPEHAAELEAYFQSRVGGDFHVEIRFVDAIDWGPSPKRLAFRCEV